jgi:hypothetical protein
MVLVPQLSPPAKKDRKFILKPQIVSPLNCKNLNRTSFTLLREPVLELLKTQPYASAVFLKAFVSHGEEGRTDLKSLRE